MRLKRSQIPAILWTLAIVSSCLLPASSFESFTFDKILHVDKLIHFTMYTGFFVLWRLTFQHWSVKHSICLFLIATLLGLSIEVLQGIMKYGRSYDIADMIANTIGSLLGVFLSPFIINRLPLIKKYLPFMAKLYR